MIEEVGQNNRPNQVEEGTVEQNLGSLGPRYLLIIGTSCQIEHVGSRQLPIKDQDINQTDGKDKGEGKAGQSWELTGNNIRSDNPNCCGHGQISPCKHGAQGIAAETLIKEGFLLGTGRRDFFFK